jgi:hypothetical protein
MSNEGFAWGKTEKVNVLNYKIIMDKCKRWNTEGEGTD